MAHLNQSIKWCIRNGNDETDLSGHRKITFQGRIPYNMYSEIYQAVRLWNFSFNCYKKTTDIASVEVMFENQNQICVTYKKREWADKERLARKSKKNPYWD